MSAEPLLVAMERDDDPYAVMVPTAEIIRFSYGPSTRLAQARFWGEYDGTFNADRSVTAQAKWSNPQRTQTASHLE